MRSGLLAARVRPGEVVAAYLPNIPEAVAAMLACASLGAIWACCAPEMGVTGALDRLSQLRPVVLLSVDGYRYGARRVERSAEAVGILAGLPAVRRAVWLPYLVPDAPAPEGWTAWAAFAAAGGPLEFASLEFDHPSTSSSRRGPPAGPRRSCTATAASSWSTSRRSASTSTWERVTASSGSRPPAG